MRLFGLLLMIVASPLAGGVAQQDPPGRRSAPDSTTLARLQQALEGRDRVRVVRGGIATHVGSLVLDYDGIRVGDGPDLRHVPWTQVSRIQVRSSGFTQGLVLGAAGGGAFGAILGLMIGGAATQECGGPGFEPLCGAGAGDVVTATLVFAVGSAAFFGLLGGAVGAGSDHWSTVYQARPTHGLPSITVGPQRGGGFAVRAAVRF